MLDKIEGVVKRFEAWLRGGIHDRPPVTFPAVWRDCGDALPKKAHATPLEAVLDVEFRIEYFEKALPFLDSPGDSVPTFTPGIGIGQIAALFGGRVEMNQSSCWAVHNLENVRDVIGREPDLAHPFHAAMRRMTDLSLERGRGRWLTGIYFPQAAPDILADLRGPEKLCFDLVDDPEGVGLACWHISRRLTTMWDDLYSRIAATGQPTAGNGEGVIARGRVARIDCDFLCMISRAMAAEVFDDVLRDQVRRFDRCYWHVDGQGWLTHLDSVLQNPDVGAVQWVYGAGRGPASRWVDVYRRIQDAGKGIELMPESLDDARAVMKELRPEGVWLKFWPRYPVEEAELFVAEAARPGNWRRQ